MVVKSDLIEQSSRKRGLADGRRADEQIESRPDPIQSPAQVPKAEKFFVLPSVDYKRENILTGGEIVTEIIVPAPKPGSKGFYYKVRERLAWDHAIVTVATIVESSGGAVRDARVVMGRRSADSLARRESRGILARQGDQRSQCEARR